MPLTENLRAIGRFSNLEPGRLDRVAARLRRPADRIYQARSTRLSGLARLGQGVGGRVPATPPRVLVASLRGWSTHSACELIIAHALRVRGARVALLTCGGGMPACEVGWERRAHPRPCDRCAWLTDRLAGQSGLEHFALRDQFEWGADGRRAPHAVDSSGSGDPYLRSRVSLTWLMRATRFERLPEGPSARADFAVAAEGVQRAAGAILDQFDPEVVFLLNGLFAAENTIREVALKRGLRVPTYEIAPRAGCLVFSQETPAPYYDTDALWHSVSATPLSPRQRADVVALLDARVRGVGAHERYFDDPEEDLAQLRRRLAVPTGGRVVTLFTNVSWDSATFARDVGFASMFEWIIEAVKRAAELPDLTLVIRIHPGEEIWGTREHVEAEVLEALGRLPSNVRIVPADESLSSYALADLSDLVLTYTTTLGLEAAARGRPVAVAGQTHYRGRGFTIDVEGPEGLGVVLADPPGPLDEERVELALRYAFAFFFRAMVPFPAMRSRGPWVTQVPASGAELAPGADPYLDWICARILDGEDFSLPDQLATPGAELATA